MIAYWFSKTYTIVSDYFLVDKDFIESHDFYVTVTEKSARNSYDSDTIKVLKTLKLNTEYKLQSMSVSQSSTYIQLVEFPDMMFNSVNFVFLDKFTPKNNNIQGCVTIE